MEVDESLEITVNGAVCRVDGCSPETTLLEWLRESRGLTGTKMGCAEGDCGACTVALIERGDDGGRVVRSINSCIALVRTLAGREILTVEGLARGGELHSVQRAMVECNGSQCGFCTPGFVMSLYEGYERGVLGDAAKVADQIGGNLCRCTGYRAIAEAAGNAFSRGDAEAQRNEGVSREGAKERKDGIPLARLLEIRAEHPEAVLVAGATEVGVEVTKRFRRLPMVVSLDDVPELKRCERTADGWRLGAGATLTELEDFLGGELPIFDEMLRWFASRQIRNRATLGGNLVTGSPIGDSAPVLLALGASVELASGRGTRMMELAEFFLGYRKTALAVDEVMTAVWVPRVGDGARAEFFKVSKRREMDISIVSAAFVRVGDEVRCAFGGVAATPALVVVSRAEGEDEGEFVERVAGELAVRFEPLTDARGSAAYRRGLVGDLWRKFVLTPGRRDGEDERVSMHRSSLGEEQPPHESAVGHVTGAAKYVDDIALSRGTLTMWPVCSEHAHARILSLDVEAARAMPGVAVVLTAGDVPGVNDVGCSRPDESLFASEIVEFHGHLLAMVVGESEAACRAAARAVVVEYEKLPTVLTIAEARAAESFHTDANAIRRGDAASAVAGAARRLTGEFELGGQEHFYLETQAAWAEVAADGGIHVCSSTQHPTEIQIIVARVLGLSRNDVVVEAPRMGGGFGGKETQGNSWAALAALGAVKTGRPVRVMLDRDLDMRLTGKRHPFWSRFEVGLDDDGVLVGAEVELISNGGWSLDLSMPIADRALFHLDNAYYVPAVNFSARVAKTNLVSNTAFRGFGGPQGMVVIEEILDRVARELGLAPEVVRERNLYRGSGETNTTHYGQEVGDNRVREMWMSLKESARLAERRVEISEWNAGSALVKRGIAMTPVKFGISFTYTPYNQAGALVLVYADGTVQVNHGGTEMGQGLHTKILGIVMRELGVPRERVRMMFTRTDKVPNTSATAASSGADLNGAAVADACRTLVGRMTPVAAEMLGGGDGRLIGGDGKMWFEGRPEKTVEFPQLCNAMHMQRVSLSATGFYKTPGIEWDRATGKGRPFAYFACGVAVSEVEVDGRTGMHRVLRTDILHDVGDSLNERVDRGQIEGGFVQGMGWLTREELKWDGEGKLLTSGASTYAIPAFSDRPADFRVSLLAKATNEGTIGGSKAVGEPPLMLAISVREALRDAVAAFGDGEGMVELAAPASVEQIWWAVKKRLGAGGE